MQELPTGTVTFLFTDIEGSTKLLERVPAAYGKALERHHEILRSAVAANDGLVFETVGDAIYAAFSRPSDAVTAALEAQLALHREPWGETGEIRVRMGLHTGEVERRGDHYFGRALYRCARLMATGHGGQVLVSAITASLVRDDLPAEGSLRSLGSHRLKDLGDPEEPHQLMHAELIAEFPPLRSLNARPNNLPIELSTFIGRDRELSELRHLLGSRRLVTITGLGGTGKSRLALQVAAEAIDSFSDGAFFVALAAVADPQLVIPEIAKALGVNEAPGQLLEQRLKDHLSGKQLLLVLDNFEQVIAAAGAIADLLGGAAGLRVLVTSLAPLRIAGEQEYPAAPLEVPDLRDLPTLETIAQCDAVRLFIERATQARPDFAITSENAPTIAEICHRLDGLPLAIELAAARSKLLDPKALLSRLERRLSLLVGGRRDTPARHQTLRAAIDWTHDLLADNERELFRELAVFVGGFTLEEAEAVCGSAGVDVLAGVSALADNGLIRRDDAATERFTMLATVREYALEMLGSDPSAAALRRRHVEHFLDLAERSPGETPDERRAWYDRLERDHENIRGALEWATQTGDASIGLRLALAAWRHLWVSGGHWTEGMSLLRALLAVASAAAPTHERAAALAALASLATLRGDLTEGRLAIEESIPIWRTIGEEHGLAVALNRLGLIYEYGGDYAKADASFEEALPLARRADPELVRSLLHNIGIAAAFRGDLDRGQALLEEALEGTDRPTTLGMLGEVARMRGDYQLSAELLERSVERARSMDRGPVLANWLTTLALTYLLLGDVARAAASCSEGLQIGRRLGQQQSLCIGLEVMAMLAVERGQEERAAQLFGAAEALRGKTGLAVWEPIRLHAERARELARERLGHGPFGRAYEAGRSMPLERTISSALEVGSSAV